MEHLGASEVTGDPERKMVQQVKPRGDRMEA